MFKNIVSTKKTKWINLIPITLMLGLIILRFPLTILSNFHVVTILNTENLYQNYTYLFTASLIFWERKKLSKFNFDLVTIFLFIAIPIIKPLIYFMVENSIPCNFPSNFSWFQIIIACILSILLILSPPKVNIKITKQLIEWLIIAVIAGITYAFLTSKIYYLHQGKSVLHFTIPIFLQSFITQLSIAAVMEEPLFRGFGWGYLKNMNLKDYQVCIIQAFLFCIGHIYYLPSAPVYFIGTFICGLILGFIAWKSRSIATTIIAHGLINSMNKLFQLII